MDLTGTFKTEVYRPVVTIAIPGIVALSPYAYMLVLTFPEHLQLVTNYKTLAGLLGLLIVIATGFLLEDIGSFFENELLGKFHDDEDRMEQAWYKYLRLAFEIEPIGLGYLSTVVFRFKFELSFAFALVFAEIGLICILVGEFNSPPIWLLILVPAVAAYFFWETKSSSLLLAKLRQELLKGTIDGNKISA